jgi:hypothetical protein
MEAMAAALNKYVEEQALKNMENLPGQTWFQELKKEQQDIIRTMMLGAEGADDDTYTGILRDLVTSLVTYETLLRALEIIT